MQAYEDIIVELNKLAKKYSSCKKAQVGARIVSVSRHRTITEGFNYTMPGDCKSEGCHRMKVYGEDSCNHRLPSDCYAIHAEIAAIAMAAGRCSRPIANKTMIVTRYPCEACARAIVAAGITKVVYSGAEEISEQTKEIFDKNNVKVIFIPNVR